MDGGQSATSRRENSTLGGTDGVGGVVTEGIPILRHFTHRPTLPVDWSKFFYRGCGSGQGNNQNNIILLPTKRSYPDNFRGGQSWGEPNNTTVLSRKRYKGGSGN